MPRACKRNVEEPPLWRAVAHHYTAEGDGHWHGKWRTHAKARAQALRWQQREEPDDVWIETLHGDRHEVTS